MTLREHVRLSDLIKPLDQATFFRDHFLPGRPFLSAPNPKLVAMLTSLPELSSVSELLSRVEDVLLFGPSSFRAKVPAKVALEFYNRRDTLYITPSSAQVPHVWNAVSNIAVELGILPDMLGVEVFAGRATALSTLHWDADANFQILLRGRKTWRLAQNRHIRFPLIPNPHVHTPPEELLASSLPLPTSVEHLEDVQTIEVGPGSVLFLPLGHWHEVDHGEETLALNIVIRSPRWADLIAAALRHKLVNLPAGRTQAIGILGDDPDLKKRAATNAKAALRIAKSVLSTLTLTELATSQVRTRYHFTPACAVRQLIEHKSGATLKYRRKAGARSSEIEIHDALLPLFRRLVEVRGPFTFQQALNMTRGVPADELLFFFQELIDKKLLVVIE